MREFWFRMLGRISDTIAVLRQVWDELFRERELILRSQGRVHFIPLTRRLQITAMSIVMAVALWGIGVTLMSTVKSGIIQVKNDEIREARVAYEDLFEEVLRYQKKVATVTSNTGPSMLIEGRRRRLLTAADAGRGLVQSHVMSTTAALVDTKLLFLAAFTQRRFC